jgi:phenylpyruvate tautomerase PptA (4-oxalocrotonate tautomerase family)
MGIQREANLVVIVSQKRKDGENERKQRSRQKAKNLARDVTKVASSVVTTPKDDVNCPRTVFALVQ